MKNGFITVAAAIPPVRVGDPKANIDGLIAMSIDAEKRGVELLVFPELCVTGYSCQDLFAQQTLIRGAEEAVRRMLAQTRNLDVICIIGAPIEIEGLLHNCAIVMQHGRVLAIFPKAHLPNYGEFYEKRWFVAASPDDATEIGYAGQRACVAHWPQLIRTADGVLFGVELCEDIWSPNPPATTLTLAGADIVFNLSASDEVLGKNDYLRSLLAQQSARTISSYVYAGCGFGESTQDVVFGGNAFVYEMGELLAVSERFSFEKQMVVAQIDIDKQRAERRRNMTFSAARKDHKANVIDAFPTVERPFEWLRTVSPLPFIPTDEKMKESCEEVFNIQVAGLAHRLTHIGCRQVVVGISGGLDSTLALLVCVKTFDKLGWPRTGIIGVTMPGFGTTDRTYNNALAMMKSLGITIREISIAKSVTQHFEDIGHDPARRDVTYENAQARERTQILMDLANDERAIVVGTGDLSELALGWATYNGDHMSMYGVNAGVPKTLIQYLVRYVARHEMDADACRTLLDIVDTPISPELIPADEQGNIKQKTEDLVGPYELHDFFLYYFLRYGFRPKKILLLAQKAFDGSCPAAGTYDTATIRHWLRQFLRRFFQQQFKRSCLPDGPKVLSVSLSPRGDWRMPSDAVANEWLAELEEE